MFLFNVKARSKVAIAFTCTIILVLVAGCDKTPTKPTAVVNKGTRNLGVHVTEASGHDYAEAFSVAQAAGMDCIPITLQWTALEDNNHYYPQQLLEALNLFFPVSKMPVSLCISPIAATHRDLPPDLLNKTFDDPAIIQRFNKLLDTV